MKNRPNKTKLTIAVIVGTAIGLSFSLAVVFSKTAIHGTFPVGTFVAGLNISNKTMEESVDILNSEKEKFFNTAIEIQYLNETISFSPEELSIEIMVEETLKTIEQTDAKKLGIIDLLTTESSINKNLTLITKIDYEELNKLIEEKFKTKELEPKSAKFYFNDSGELEIKEEEKGIIINTEELFEDIKIAANTLEANKITIKTIEKLPVVTKEKLVEQEGKIKEQLSQTITLVDPIYSDDWYLKVSSYLDWIEFKEKEKITIPYLEKEIVIENSIDGVDGETFIAIEIKEEKLDKYIDENISKWLDRPAEDVNIYLDEEGSVVIEGKGSSGKKVQRPLLKDALETAIAYQIEEIIIPVVDVEPKITIATELQELGVTEKIAVGHTSYYGSPGNRIHNIKTGAAKFNGILIEPGEVFSFNQNLGRVDGGTGYKKELVIKKEGTIPEYGGGICQVSTTMFRTVLFGGLPVTERNEHSYAVSYYSQVLGHGLDATIYLGGADLRFENDTGQHVLIQTYTENDYELYIVFYGTKDGRSVELEGPYLSNYHSPGATMYIDTDRLFVGETKQVENPHTGFSALWYRHLTLLDGTIETEAIETNYRAVPKKIWVGTQEKEEFTSS